MIFGIVPNVPVLVFKLVLDLLFGKEEPFDYVSTTRPEESKDA